MHIASEPPVCLEEIDFDLPHLKIVRNMYVPLSGKKRLRLILYVFLLKQINKTDFCIIPAFR